MYCYVRLALSPLVSSHISKSYNFVLLHDIVQVLVYEYMENGDLYDNLFGEFAQDLEGYGIGSVVEGIHLLLRAH